MQAPGETHSAEVQMAGIACFDELEDWEQLVETGPLDEEALEEIAAHLEARRILPHRKKAVHAACNKHGYEEKPPQSSHNMFSEYFQGKGTARAWCTDFVSWTYASTGYAVGPHHKLPWTHPERAASILEWAKATKNFVLTPEPGDIVVFENKKGLHCGLVVSVNSTGGQFTSIEGNTKKNRKDPNEKGGHFVWGHTYYIQSKYNFLRVPPLTHP